MNIIITLIVYLIVLGLLWWLVDILPLPAPIAQVVRVLFVVLLILAVLSLTGLIPGARLPLVRLG